MSAPFVQSQFQTIDETFVAVLWRGAMLDRFCRAEFQVLRCLRVLKECEFDLPEGAFSQAAKTRLAALIQFLHDYDNAWNTKAALRDATALEKLLETRNALAHGLMRICGGTASFVWSAPETSGLTERCTSFAPADMLQSLRALDKLQRDFASELGQIRKQAQLQGKG